MDVNEAYATLEKAHQAGDTATAQKMADYIRSEEAKAPHDAITPVAVHPMEQAAETVSSWNPSTWFQGQDPKDVSLQEAAGKVGGGAAAGAAGGAVIPGILKAAGKFVPGAIGKALTGMGEGMSMIPLKERVVRGAGGGAAMGAVESAADALGAAPAVKFGASMAGGGIGETTASFLTKESASLAKFIGNAAYGNLSGAARAFGGMLSPNKQLNEATARKLQKQLFGEKTDGYVNKLIGSDARVAAQEAMRKADPTLLAGPLKQGEAPRGQWDTSTGEMTPMSGSRDLAAAATGQRTPAGGFAPPVDAPLALPGPAGAGAAGANPLAKPAPIQATMKPDPAAAVADPAAAAAMASGKAGARAKLSATQQAAADAEAEAARLATRPASEIYRDRLFQGVTAGVKAGKSFSTTPEFAAFQQDIEHQVTMGNLGKTQAAELLRKLRLDRSQGTANGKVLDGYAELVDNQIRKFGKPAEGSIATGADAIDAGVARNIRSSLQQNFNKYTSRLGLGNLEQQYRGAYSTEMVAEAKDKLPFFLYKGFGKEAEFAKMAKNLAKDPQGLPFIQKSLAQHLANQEPKALVGEFDRLQSTLVNAKLLQPSDLQQLRTGAKVVSETADKGLQQKRAETLKHLMLMAMTKQAGIAGGGAAGAAQAAADDQ